MRARLGLVGRFASIALALIVVLSLAVGCENAGQSQGAAAPAAPAQTQAPPAGVDVSSPPATNASRAVAALQTQSGLVPLYKNVIPGVVSIDVVIQSYQQGTGAAAGSGFILDSQGHIVTNEHVVANATLVTVTFFDGFTAQATVLGTDPDSDLAVIQVQNMPSNVTPLPLGDSGVVQPGEWVVAVGNPFGLEGTMTFGIVSAIGRIIPTRVGSFSIPEAIQTDAAINPGNSGGPLMNLNGQVIGVNSQIETGGSTSANAGVGFALPVNTVKLVVPYLIQGQAYPWPYLGVAGTSVGLLLQEANKLPTQQGAYIDQVQPGSPAAQAGLQGSTGTTTIDGIPVPTGGDVITAVNGTAVPDFTALLQVVAFSKSGSTLNLTVLRNGQQTTVPVTLAQRPSSTGF